MAFFRRTQKQVIEHLAGNLHYYNRLRVRGRPWRFWVSGLTLLAGVAAVPAYYHFHAPESFYQPRPDLASARCDCQPMFRLPSADEP